MTKEAIKLHVKLNALSNASPNELQYELSFS